MSIFRLSSFKIEIPIVGIFIWIVNYSKIAAVINLDFAAFNCGLFGKIRL